MGCITTKTTNIALYDNMLEHPEYYRKNKNKAFKIVWMTPDEYLELCKEGNLESVKRYNFKINKYVRDLSEKYAKMMKSGVKFPMLSIEVRKSGYLSSGISFNQEGRHRALAAKLAGCEKVPVMIIFPANREEMKKIEDKITLLKKYIKLR